MKKKVPKDHTTPMLAAILSIFLIAELPQGVMLVLNGIFSSETFHKKVFKNFILSSRISKYIFSI